MRRRGKELKRMVIMVFFFALFCFLNVLGFYISVFLRYEDAENDEPKTS